MRNPNFVAIGGNLGSDAKYAVTNSGKEVVSFSFGHSRGRFDEQGQWETLNTTWWNVSYWGNDREDLQALAHQLVKGTRVVVTGRAELRPYTAKDGREGQSLDIAAASVSIFPNITKSDAQQQWNSSPSAKNPTAGFDAHGQPPF